MTALTTPRHQVAWATEQLRGIADSLVEVSVWSMDAAEAASTLVELTRLESQVTELRSRVAAHADELRVGSEVGATSTAKWLAHQTRAEHPRRPQRQLRGPRRRPRPPPLHQSPATRP